MATEAKYWCSGGLEEEGGDEVSKAPHGAGEGGSALVGGLRCGGEWCGCLSPLCESCLQGFKGSIGGAGQNRQEGKGGWGVWSAEALCFLEAMGVRLEVGG